MTTLIVPDLLAEVGRLKTELEHAHDMIDTLTVENHRLRHNFRALIDETLEVCNDLLKELNK